MSQNGKCLACGTLLTAEAAGHVCESCMLRAALHSQEEEIRRDILEMSSPEERREYLAEVCGKDLELRGRVQHWLSARDRITAVPAGGKSDGVDPGLTEVGGRYRLLRKLGEGGFGTVYLAEQTSPVTRQVAIKILKLGMDTRQIVARFERERQALALMDHPNIAKVFDAGATDGGRPYFVMELVHGAPITRFCDERELTLRDRLELFRVVCLAVQHAHQKGIIHRDLKPSNILVAVQEGSPAPKVIDFGIAKATQHELGEQTVLTEEHHLLGTPAYISPEQAALRNADIDTRSDIYSLGVLLYELLTGTTPFETTELTSVGLDEMRRIIREREPLRPSTRLERMESQPARVPTGGGSAGRPRSRVDRDLDWIVMKCLQKDQGLRYATANGLALDVQRYLAHEPVVARPPSAFYRLSKLTRRNPVVSSLTALLVLALAVAVTAGALMSLKLSRAKRETDSANRQLSDTVRYLESSKMEELAAARHRQIPLAWLASHMRQHPEGAVAASRALSMLGRYNFALPAIPPLVHDGPVNTAFFSSDEKRILTGSEDGRARLWNTETGQLLGTITNDARIIWAEFAGPDRILITGPNNHLRVHDSHSLALRLEILGAGEQRALIQDQRGTWLYTSPDQSVYRWNLESGQRSGPLLRCPSRVVFVVGSDASGRVAIGCEDQTVTLLDLATDAVVDRARRFDVPLLPPGFSPDGKRLYLPAADGKRLFIWDHASNRGIREFVPPGSVELPFLRISPDGRRLLTWSWAAPMRVWDAETLQPVTEVTGADTQGWTFYTVSGDSRLVAGLAQRGACRIWDLESGQFAIEPFEHHGRINTAVFDSTSRRVLTASQDGTAQLWDIGMRLPPAVEFPPGAGGGEARFDRPATRMLVSHDKDVVQVLDARTGKVLGPPLQHPGGTVDGHVRSASISHDNSRILTTGEAGLLRLWNAQTYQLEREIVAGRTLVLAAFSLDDRFVVAGDRTGHATVWDVASGNRMGTTTEPGKEVLGLDFHPDQKTFATAFENATARCWALPTGEPTTPPLQHQGIVWSVTYSPDGNRLVTTSADGTARVWDPRTGERLFKPLQHEKDVFSARFSPDGRWLLTTSDDGTARLWSGTTFEPLSPPMRHADGIWLGAFSPDGRWLATGSKDQTVRLWDPRTGLPMSEPLVHQGPLGRLSFSPDGLRLLTFGGQPRIWEVRRAPTPVPEWFCDLVEAVGGSRMREDGEIHPAPHGVLQELRRRLSASAGADFYSRWARWFLVERMQNPVPECPAP